MSHIYKNITTTDATVLTYRGDGIVYNSISIVNISASYEYSVDLYILKEGLDDSGYRVLEEDGVERESKIKTEEVHYILKTVLLPVGTTLMLNADDLVFDSANYESYIKINDITGSGVTVDVNINFK